MFHVAPAAERRTRWVPAGPGSAHEAQTLTVNRKRAPRRHVISGEV